MFTLLSHVLFMLNVVMLTGVCAACHVYIVMPSVVYAECRYAECAGTRTDG
jgi:hypothetical protein